MSIQHSPVDQNTINWMFLCIIRRVHKKVSQKFSDYNFKSC